MTLEEYEKVLEEKRKALLALKAEERKVDVDKDFESMQLKTKKKVDDEVFIQLVSCPLFRFLLFGVEGDRGGCVVMSVVPLIRGWEIGNVVPST